jgi:hypothetical protein
VDQAEDGASAVLSHGRTQTFTEHSGACRQISRRQVGLYAKERLNDVVDVRAASCSWPGVCISYRAGLMTGSNRTNADQKRWGALLCCTCSESHGARRSICSSSATSSTSAGCCCASCRHGTATTASSCSTTASRSLSGLAFGFVLSPRGPDGRHSGAMRVQAEIGSRTEEVD